MKKLISALLAMAMVFTLFQTQIFASSVLKSGDYFYTVSGLKATITGYTGAGGSVAIPRALGGYIVNEIGDSSFQGNTNLTGVTIPFNVAQIDDNAFQGCSAMTAAYFLGTAPAMGTGVFDGCASTFTVYYIGGATGFNNPWCGYPTSTYVQAATSIKLNYTKIKMETGTTGNLRATVLPANAINQAVDWKSSNTAVVVIDRLGIVTAKVVGTATITCTAKDGSGVKATCTVAVIPVKPADLKAVKATSTSIKLTWKAVTGATGYYVLSKTSKNGAYTKTKVTAATYTNKNLTKGHTYFYKVEAYKTVGGTAYISRYSSVVRVVL